MSTAVALPKSQTRAEVFVGEVLPPDRLESVLSQLPAHVKPERFQRNLVVAITQHPRLLDCDPVAVFNEVSKAAALGLYFDPQLGEAYLITGFSNGRYVPQLRLGYRGLIKLTRQSGAVATVYAHDVCANDKFKMSLGTNKFLEHEPDYLKDRGEIGLYYAVVKFADGETDFEPMSVKDIHRIRDRSDGWRAFKAGKIKSTPWGTDEGEMAKKTVLRRLLKRLPQSPEIADALRIDDEDFREVDDAIPARIPLSARLVSGTSQSGFSRDHVEIETTGGASTQTEPREQISNTQVAETVTTEADPSQLGQTGEKPVAESNSSQASPQAHLETDKPASVVPPADAGNLSQAKATEGKAGMAGDADVPVRRSTAGSGLQVGEASADLPTTSEFMDVTAGETAPNSNLADDWRDTYLAAMARVNSRPKSLPDRHAEAIQLIGGKANDFEQSWMKAAYALTKFRLDSGGSTKITAAEVEAELNP